MVVHFLKGKYKLGIVFWGFAVLPLLLYNFLSIFMFTHFFTLSSEYTYFELGCTLFLILPFIYFPFVMVAVWNSANHYAGSKLWRISAKVMIGILLLVLVYYAEGYFLSKYSNKYTDVELITLSNDLNKSLPQVIEPNVLITKTSFEKHHFLFQYQVTDKVRSELDIKTFVIAFRGELTRQVCQDNFTKKVLINNFLVDYQYLDKNSEEIYTFNFKKEDCDFN